MISRSRCAQRSLVAMHATYGTGPKASPGRARTVLRRAGIEESYTTPLICAVQAREPCTGEMSRRRAGNSSVPSTCGPC